MKKRRTKRSNKLKIGLPILVVIIVLIGVYGYWATNRALPIIKPVQTISVVDAASPSGSLPWPGYGESAIGLNGSGVQATSGVQKVAPIASVAKLITALCVLSKKPLLVGQQGPTITLTQADVNIYNKYNAEDGSDTEVVAGENITEYQMLEAMLLPSADNMADSLAIWAFGSLANYQTYANKYIASHGLANTHVGSDASGYDPSTTSTASDLIKLGQLAMQNPVIASIVSMPSASGIPVVGSVQNVNHLLGQHNIDGIKTGNTDQAGGVFLSSSKTMVNGAEVNVYTAIMGGPTLAQVLSSSATLIPAAQANFGTVPYLSAIHSGTVVGSYKVPWNSQDILATASGPISLDVWKGTKVNSVFKLDNIKSDAKANQIVGSVTATDRILGTSVSVPIIINKAPSKPSKWWLLLHPSYDFNRRLI